VALLDAGSFDTPSTKTAADALAKWGAKRSTLIVLADDEAGVAKSFRNIPKVHVADVGAIGVADVIGAASLVVSEAALAKLQERLG
jgi:large subunit ribosomal protein L4